MVRDRTEAAQISRTPAYLSPASPASIVYALVFLAEPELLQPSVLGLIDE